MTSVLITGANRGIGFEFVRQYAADGARVYACCRSPEKAKSLQALAADSGGDVAIPNVTIHRLDVTDDSAIAALAKELHGVPIDILINNAGIAGDLHTYQPADGRMWDEVLHTNTVAPFRIAWTLKPNLEKGTMRKIVNISSGRASHQRHRGDGIAYCSSKAALNSSMYGLSVLWKDDRFIIVMIAPGVVRTDMNPRGRLTPEYSIGCMRAWIAELKTADNGRYVSYEGNDIAW